MRKIESFCTGSGFRASCCPIALKWTIFPCRVEQRDEAGDALLVDERFIAASMRRSRSDEMPTDSGGGREIANCGRRGNGAELRQARDGSQDKETRECHPRDLLLRVFESSWLH